jgi:hypothetical protein
MHQRKWFFGQVVVLQSLVISVTLLGAMGCRELVQDEFPDITPVPVVNSFLVADSLISVHVSLTGGLDTVPLKAVNDALVDLYVNDSAKGRLSSAGSGLYTSELRVHQGNVIRLRVGVPGYPEITATDTIPLKVKISRIKHINIAGVDEEGYAFPALLVTFPVDPGRIQYFQVSFRVQSWNDNWREGYYKDFNDPVLQAEGLPIAVFSTAGMRDTSYTMQLDYSTGAFSNSSGTMQMDLFPLFVEFRSISRNFYEYQKQLYLYETGRYPEFQLAPFRTFPLHSNVTNGMGVVAGYSIYRSEIITPEK